MTKQRLDKTMLQRSLTDTRSAAENWIRLGKVLVNGAVAKKPGQLVDDRDDVVITAKERYVSRAGLKLSSVARKLRLDFSGVTVLDVGSSTGGFTDYALQHGARRVVAVDVGTDQLHPILRADERVELHEKTDIRDFMTDTPPDIVVMDVSFISSRQVLPHIASLCSDDTQLAIMVKPQFEAQRGQLTRGGIVKNNTVRRTILADFELWSKRYFVIRNKADSDVKGAGGNAERFYLLQKKRTRR